MSNTPEITVRDFEKILEKTGWQEESRTKKSGSGHKRYHHEKRANVVQVSHHAGSDSIGKGTLHGMFNDAGLGSLYRDLVSGQIRRKLSKVIKQLTPEAVIPS